MNWQYIWFSFKWEWNWTRTHSNHWHCTNGSRHFGILSIHKSKVQCVAPELWHHNRTILCFVWQMIQCSFYLCEWMNQRVQLLLYTHYTRWRFWQFCVETSMYLCSLNLFFAATIRTLAMIQIFFLFECQWYSEFANVNYEHAIKTLERFCYNFVCNRGSKNILINAIL